MNHEEAKNLLDEYVDGELDTHRHSAVAEHVQQCADCRDEAARISALTELAAGLPDDHEPQRDLWPDIAAAIGTAETESTVEPVVQSKPRIWRLAGRRFELSDIAAFAATAAVLLILVGIWQGQTSSGDMSDQLLAHQETDYGTLAMINALDAETRTDCREVMALAPYEGGPTRSAVLTALNRDLKDVNQAIDQLRNAWLADSGNQRLARQLATACRTRARLQEKTNRFSIIL